MSPPNESLEPQGFGDSFFAFGVFLALFLALPAIETPADLEVGLLKILRFAEWAESED